MGAHGLCLELRALLLTALPELLPTLSAANLVVGVTVSSALRKLVLAVIKLLPLAKARRSCGARPSNCLRLGDARFHQCRRIADRLNVQDLNVEIEVLLEIGELRHRAHRKPR